MKKFYALAMTMAAFTAWAEPMDITVTEAGTLPGLLTESQQEEISELKISGPLNGTDLKLLRWMTGIDEYWRITPGQLRYLDMSGAVLVEGGESYAAAHNTETLADPIWMYARTDALPEQLFSGSILETIVLPTSIKKIYSSFSDANYLKGKIVVPEGVQVVGEWAFSATEIEEIELPATLTYTNVPGGAMYNNEPLGSHVFEGCRKLTKITLPACVTALRDATFKDCSALKEITIPATLKELGSENFSGCTALTDIHAEAATPAKAAYRAFAGLDHDAITLHVPEGAAAVYGITDEWKKFTDIREDYGQVGIGAVEADVEKADAPLYNLQGVRVTRGADLPAGIYISEGKKVIIK